MDAPAVHPHIEHHDDVLDDLAEGQGDDGQVVTLEAEHRHAHDRAAQGTEGRPHRHGHRQAQGGHGDGALQQDGGGDAGEGPQAHEARVAQGQLAQNAHRQVQGHRHHDVAAGGHQQGLEGVGQPARAHQDLERGEGGDDDAVIDKPVEGVLVEFLFHGRLTLSRARTCP